MHVERMVHTACHTAVTMVVIIDIIVMALLGTYYSCAKAHVRGISGEPHGECGSQAALSEAFIVKIKTVQWQVTHRSCHGLGPSLSALSV